MPTPSTIEEIVKDLKKKGMGGLALIHVRNALTKAYNEGFIDGGHASGEQAKEIHAIELVEARNTLIQEIIDEMPEEKDNKAFRHDPLHPVNGHYVGWNAYRAAAIERIRGKKIV